MMHEGGEGGGGGGGGGGLHWGHEHPGRNAIKSRNTKRLRHAMPTL